MASIDRLSRTWIRSLIRSVVWDKDRRGVHLEKILSRYGHIPVVKVAFTLSEEERAHVGEQQAPSSRSWS